MKNLLAIVHILLFLMFAHRVNACGAYARDYLACDYLMFRACGNDMKGITPSDTQSAQECQNENCRQWAALTSTTIPTADICEVVYHWDKQKVSLLHQATRGELKNYRSNNRFANWIVEHHDQEVADFLLLAKESETIRQQMNDPWHYSDGSDELQLALQQLAQTAMEHHGQRLGDRYVLQALRALFVCRMYNECLTYWEQCYGFFHEGIIKRLAQGYVAGSLYHIGEKDAAVKLYISIGELYEAYTCSASSETFDRWVYTIQPDHDIVIRQLQATIHQIERWQGEFRDIFDNDCNYDKEKYAQIYPYVRRIISERRCKNMAPWYYAGAFIADKLDHKHEAMTFIRRAKNAHPDADLQASIRVLDFYLSVKYSDHYDLAFENKVFAQLRWLDGMIVNHLDDDTRQTIVKGGFNHHINGYSQYYWSDMMRRIVISQLVPLCLRSGFQTRALQYLNMADNRLFGLVTDTSISRWEFDSEKGYVDLPDTLMTIAGYRDYVGHHNEYDYCNDYFINLDSLGVRYVKRLAYRMQHPQCPLDSFLNERSYSDPRYLNDIIGTQLIAAGRFAEAIPYLEQVDESFNRSRNVYLHCNIDPFTLRKQAPDAHYRLHYAQEMSRLERDIRTCTHPNEKAQLMLRYARGMIHSVGIHCWPLTSFYWGNYSQIPFYSRYQVRMIERTDREAQRIRERAFSLFTDSEQAARAYYDWNMFQTVVSKYPQSATADYIRGHCDELKDYRISADLIPCRRYE